MKLQNVSQKLISSHLISGEMTPGSEIGLKIDQVLLQDATGTLVMLELEAFNLNKLNPRSQCNMWITICSKQIIRIWMTIYF